MDIFPPVLELHPQKQCSRLALKQVQKQIAFKQLGAFEKETSQSSQSPSPQTTNGSVPFNFLIRNLRQPFICLRGTEVSSLNIWMAAHHTRTSGNNTSSSAGHSGGAQLGQHTRQARGENCPSRWHCLVTHSVMIYRGLRITSTNRKIHAYKLDYGQRLNNDVATTLQCSAKLLKNICCAENKCTFHFPEELGKK